MVKLQFLRMYRHFEGLNWQYSTCGGSLKNTILGKAPSIGNMMEEIDNICKPNWFFSEFVNQNLSEKTVRYSPIKVSINCFLNAEKKHCSSCNRLIFMKARNCQEHKIGIIVLYFQILFLPKPPAGLPIKIKIDCFLPVRGHYKAHSELSSSYFKSDWKKMEEKEFSIGPSRNLYTRFSESMVRSCFFDVSVATLSCVTGYSSIILRNIFIAFQA